MLFSKSFIFTTREDPKSAECVSHRLLLRGNFIFMVSAGIYAYLPLGYRVLNKIINIIRRQMEDIGAQELLMSALQPLELWVKTGRDKDLEEVMFRLKDRKERDLCLGPTHEEEITEIVRKSVTSYRQLPLILYQIQVKFRDEPRPRFGLVRGCEFIMKDAYSFDVDEDGLGLSYEKMYQAYQAIFKECGLEFIVTEAESGFMGGEISHEFMAPALIGEDIMFYCPRCRLYLRQQNPCPQCQGQLEEKRMIELAHVFKLGTKYSLAQEAHFLDNQGRLKPIIMGCYGIGVSRLLAAIVEQNHDEKGIIWPESISPFDIEILVLEESLLTEAISLEQKLIKKKKDVLIDERAESSGVKFNDAMLLGCPYILVMGKNYLKSRRIDLELRRTKEKLSLTEEELLNYLK